MRVASIMALVLAALSGGCVHSELFSSSAKSPVVVDPVAPLERRLTEAAVRAETALTDLARLRAAENPADLPPLPRIVPVELLRPVTLVWTGPLDTLVAKLAAEAGYAMIAAGPRPVRPVIVVVKAEEKPLVLVLRDAGIQAGAAATVSVDADRRMVLLDWSPAVFGKEML